MSSLRAEAGLCIISTTCQFTSRPAADESLGRTSPAAILFMRLSLRRRIGLGSVEGGAGFSSIE